MRKVIVLGMVAALMASASVSAKSVELFKCDFDKGGKVVATRNANNVNITFTDAKGKRFDMTNPLQESGVSNVEAIDGTVVDGLDLLSGDTQFSLSYQHGKLMDRAQFLVMNNNEDGTTYDCDMTTVVNHLNDEKATAGIFRP